MKTKDAEPVKTFGDHALDLADALERVLASYLTPEEQEKVRAAAKGIMDALIAKTRLDLPTQDDPSSKEKP